MLREKREGWYRKDASREKRRIPRKMMVGERKGRMLRERTEGWYRENAEQEKRRMIRKMLIGERREGDK